MECEADKVPPGWHDIAHVPGSGSGRGACRRNTALRRTAAGRFPPGGCRRRVHRGKAGRTGCRKCIEAVRSRGSPSMFRRCTPATCSMSVAAAAKAARRREGSTSGAASMDIRCGRIAPIRVSRCRRGSFRACARRATSNPASGHAVLRSGGNGRRNRKTRARGRRVCSD